MCCVLKVHRSGYHVWKTKPQSNRTIEDTRLLNDLYSRTVVGWSMKPTMATKIALEALLIAVWRRKPKQAVMIHSVQGSQFGSDDCA